MGFDVVTAADPRWAETFQALPASQRDVFYGPAYAAVCQETLAEDHRVRAALWRDGDAVLLYPFVQRRLDRVTGMREAAALGHDITGLYGRNGIVGAAGNGETLSRFHDAFAAWCRDSEIVCSFDRYHPVMANEGMAPAQAPRVDIGPFVVVDLRPAWDDIEASFKYALRKELRKGDRAGVETFVETGTEHLSDFLSIYEETLNRNGARPFYYFPDSFYRALCARMDGQYAFFYGAVDGEVVTAELVLFEGLYSHSFLGGTRSGAYAKSPNQVLKRSILRHAKERGCHYFLLGAGQAPDDGITRYKLAYAPEGALPSVIGGTVYAPAAYESRAELMRALGREPPAGRLQFYDLN
jgi:CelD/BcsL family acetyltransferase involved in cellulose biosynthesis